MSGFTRSQAIKGTTSIFTRSLRHVDAVLPRRWTRRVTFQDPRVKDVKPKDRIKWWNIVPGDQVRVRGDSEGVLREVQTVNKLRNMVYLKWAKEDTAEAQATRGQGVRYSECQLYIGKHTFPPAAGSSEPRELPVFATRIEMTSPRWLKQRGHFTWTRIAANMTPRVPGLSKNSDERMTVPWPKPPARPKIDPTLYDTTLDDVRKITYIKPALPKTTKQPLPKPPSEQRYINSLSKLARMNPAAPMEVHLQKELTNPHSRAKKQARWQAHKKEQRALLEQMMKAEVQNLKGRTRREARLEAVWKWKNRVIEERQAELERRRVLRGEVARLERKKVMKVRKAARIERKLQGLVLDNAPNQVIPPGQATA